MTEDTPINPEILQLADDMEHYARSQKSAAMDDAIAWAEELRRHRHPPGPLADRLRTAARQTFRPAKCPVIAAHMEIIADRLDPPPAPEKSAAQMWWEKI